MYCSHHPEKKAVAKCSVCRKSLCDVCASIALGNTILCSGCQVKSAIKGLVKTEAKQQEEKKLKERQEQEDKKKAKLKKWVVLGCVALMIFIGNIFIYYSSPLPQAEAFKPHNHIMAAAVMVDTAIKAYMQDHDGHAPEALDKLYGKYISQQILSPDVLRRFEYNKASDKIYTLNVRNADQMPMSDIQFRPHGFTP